MARKVKVDLTGVESYTRASEGIHTAKIASIELTQSQGGDDMLKITYEIIKGEDKGCKVFDNIVLTEKALWKLKLLLQAIGMKADGKVALDLDKMEGKICDIDVIHEEYNGQLRAKVSEVTKAGSATTEADIDEDDEEEEEEEEEEEKSAPKKPSKKSKSVNDEDDDDDEADEEETTPKKPAKAEKKTTKSKKPEPVEEDEEDEEDWDDDEEEEEEEIKPSKKPAKKPENKKKAAPKKKPESEDEDDDDEDWEEV